MTPTLRLTVLEPDDIPAPDRVRAVTGTPLRIGREDDNDWVLTDSARRMSRHHCAIDFRGGVYLVIDTSANGVFLNDAPQPIGRGNSRILSDGDRLRFPGMTLAVSLIEDQGAHDAFRAVLPPRHDTPPPTAGAAPTSPLEDLLARPAGSWWANPLDDIALPEAPGAGAPFEAAAFSSLNLTASALDGGPLAWAREGQLDPAPPAPASWSGFSGDDRSEPEHQAFPSALPGQTVIPEDWDLGSPPGAGLGGPAAIPPDWGAEPPEPPGRAAPQAIPEAIPEATPTTPLQAAPQPAPPGDDALLLTLVAALARIERALLGPDTGLMQGPTETTLHRLRATEPALAGRAVALIAERAAERIEATSQDRSPDQRAGPPVAAEAAAARLGDHEA